MRQGPTPMPANSFTVPDPDAAARLVRVLGRLMQYFAEVLEDLGEREVAHHLPWQDLWRGAPGPAGWPDPPPPRLVEAQAIAFQLLAQAEENATAQRRRAAETSGDMTRDPGGWDQHLARLKARGLPAEAVADAIASLRIEPVLTAHPTEAHRHTVLSHHRAIYRLVVDLENSMWTPAERAALGAEIRAHLERLWRTGGVFLEKPSVADERRNQLHYLTVALPAALPWADARLQAAWERAGFDPALLRLRLPRISFGSWVGGDRDGHPFVDAATTAETLALFRAEALEMQRVALCELGAKLSLSKIHQPTPVALTDWIADRAPQLGGTGAAALARNPAEPWRQAVNLMVAALPPEVGPRPAGAYARATDLATDLRRLAAALEEVGAARLVTADIQPVLRLVETFGFHLAVLDIRQNAAFHDRALGQLLATAGEPDGTGFADWPADRRAILIRHELGVLRPFALPDVSAGREADDVVGALKVCAAHLAEHGPEGLGALIVSMTRSAEDLFAVQLFAREAGLLRHDHPDGPWLPLPVVPLLETIDDLQAGPAILAAWLDAPMVRRSLERQAQAAGTGGPVQQVMVGYSDSGKDGGIVASVWAIHRAQDAIAAVGRARGVRIRFFHGRGGSIGRGAGPTHRFLGALPRDSVQGDLRLTEQGETIAQKYANRVTAAHELELLCAGTLGATLTGTDDPPDLVAAMSRLAGEARVAWRRLVEAEGFLDFFAEATPIDAIEEIRIGSRPARRTGRRTLDDLRAIPWVFAWAQSRFGLPGWYGLGAGLEALRAANPDAFAALVAAKAETTRWLPVHYLVSNAATAWLTSDPEIMGAYAGLAQDRATAERILASIRAEHARTGAMLTEIYGAPLAEARPEVHAVLTRRAEALAPLHRHQIALLADWRAHRSAGHATAETRLAALLPTLNAIAAGLGATG